MHARARADAGVLRRAGRRLRRVRQGRRRHPARPRWARCAACAERAETNGVPGLRWLDGRRAGRGRAPRHRRGRPALAPHRDRRLRAPSPPPWPPTSAPPAARSAPAPRWRAWHARLATRGSSSAGGETLEADRVDRLCRACIRPPGPRLGRGRRAADRPLPRRVLRAGAGARRSGQGPHLSRPRSDAALPGRPSDAGGSTARCGWGPTRCWPPRSRAIAAARRLARALRDADAGPGPGG